MGLNRDSLTIDPIKVEERTVRFVRAYLEGVERTGVVMGISGE